MSTKRIVVRDFGNVLSEDGYHAYADGPGNYFLAGEQVEELERVETAPYTQRVFEILENHYSALNSWCHTWPHFEVENVAEKRRQEMRACLEAQVEGLPLEVGIVALRRCFLVYQSDGDARTQTDYLYVAPPGSQCNYWKLPGSTLECPFGTFVLPPERAEAWKGNSSFSAWVPVLYAGPAWAVLVRIGGCKLNLCRIFVRDSGEFLCTDLCQRNVNKATGGINLQVGMYSLASWCMGPGRDHLRRNGLLKVQMVVGDARPQVRGKVQTLAEIMEEAASKEPPLRALYLKLGTKKAVYEELVRRFEAREWSRMVGVPILMRGSQRGVVSARHALPIYKFLDGTSEFYFKPRHCEPSGVSDASNEWRRFRVNKGEVYGMLAKEFPPAEKGLKSVESAAEKLKEALLGIEVVVPPEQAAHVAGQERELAF